MATSVTDATLIAHAKAGKKEASGNVRISAWKGCSTNSDPATTSGKIESVSFRENAANMKGADSAKMAIPTPWSSPAELFLSKPNAPVSYTHLDVYKRQILWGSGYLRIQQPSHSC